MQQAVFTRPPLGRSVPIVGDGAKYETIAAAIAAVSSGQTIYVEPGTYNETDLVLPAGVSLVGLDRMRCRLAGPTDHKSTMTLSGNNRVSNLTVAAYPGVSIDGGASVAIDLADAVTPIVIEGVDIECGTDGIYTQYGSEVTGNGLIIVRDCVLTRPAWDVIRIDIAATYAPTIIIEACQVLGEGDQLDAIIQCLLAAATMHVRNCLVDVITNEVEGATPKVASCFIRTKAQGSGERGVIYSSGNRVRIRATEDRHLAFAEYQWSASPAYMDSLHSVDDSVDLSGGTGTKSFINARFSGSLPSAPNTQLGVLSVRNPRIVSVDTPVFRHRYDNFPEVFSPPDIRGGDVLSFEVVAQPFADLTWTDSGDHETGTLSKAPYEPFQAYTYRAADKLVISNTDSDANLTAPRVATITAKGADGVNVSITLDDGAVSVGSVSAKCDGHIMTRDVDCGRGNLATMTIDENCTVHISGTPYVGQRLTLVMTCDGTGRTVTFGSGMTMSGSSTQAMTASTKTIVELISDGTTFHEQARMVDL